MSQSTLGIERLRISIAGIPLSSKVRTGARGGRELLVHHQGDDLPLAQLLDRSGGHMLPVTENRGPVGDLEDRIEVVGDIDDRDAAALEIPDDPEETPDNLLAGDTQVTHPGVWIDGDTDALAQRLEAFDHGTPIEERKHGATGHLMAQEHILERGGFGDQAGLLMDHPNPGPEGVGWVLEVLLLPIDDQGP